MPSAFPPYVSHRHSGSVINTYFRYNSYKITSHSGSLASLGIQRVGDGVHRDGRVVPAEGEQELARGGAGRHVRMEEAAGAAAPPHPGRGGGHGGRLLVLLHHHAHHQAAAGHHHAPVLVVKLLASVFKKIV
jgi:hypothetical protein